VTIFLEKLPCSKKLFPLNFQYISAIEAKRLDFFSRSSVMKSLALNESLTWVSVVSVRIINDFVCLRARDAGLQSAGYQKDRKIESFDLFDCP
jgi:hypothetical protein